MASQLAELEARELAQIERALARLKQGIYGLCEGCQKKIPVGRLNALPFSTTCVECAREMELYGTMGGGQGKDDWEKVSEVQSRLEEPREVDLTDLEFDMSSHR